MQKGITKLLFAKEDERFQKFNHWVSENGVKNGKWDSSRLIFFHSKDETKNLFSFHSNESPLDEIIILNNEILHTDPTFLEFLSKISEFTKRQIFHVNNGVIVLF